MLTKVNFDGPKIKMLTKLWGLGHDVRGCATSREMLTFVNIFNIVNIPSWKTGVKMTCNEGFSVCAERRGC